DHRREQRLLVAEMAVDGELGDAGLGGDLVHAGALVAMQREHALGRLEDGRALGEVLGATGAGLPGRSARLAGRGTGHGLILYQSVLYLCSRAARRCPALGFAGGFRGRRSALDSGARARPARSGRPANRGCALEPTDTRNPDTFHRVVDCQWACPAHTPVPEYIRLIAAGRHADAYMVNWQSNVFPGILGRTCDRPCEPA